MAHLAFSKKDDYTRCMNSAVYSLAMREHSRQEIYNKLLKKDFSKSISINALLDELEEKDYLNERRFTESFIRYRSSRGQGPIKISNELKQRGISPALINQCLSNANIDWFFIATQQYEKKFGNKKAVNLKEKSKQMRFLLGRGFDWDVIRELV